MHVCFFLFKLGSGQVLNERLYMDTPCKNKAYQLEAILTFLKSDCVWNHTTSLGLLDSINKYLQEGKRFGNMRRVVFQILKCIWDGIGLGLKHPGSYDKY